jgi:hypothetical protein
MSFQRSRANPVGIISGYLTRELKAKRRHFRLIRGQSTVALSRFTSLLQILRLQDKQTQGNAFIAASPRVLFRKVHSQTGRDKERAQMIGCPCQ